MALVLESAKKIRFFYFFIEKTATRYTLFARYILGAHCNFPDKIKLQSKTSITLLSSLRDKLGLRSFKITEMKDTI